MDHDKLCPGCAKLIALLRSTTADLDLLADYTRTKTVTYRFADVAPDVVEPTIDVDVDDDADTTPELPFADDEAPTQPAPIRTTKLRKRGM